MSGSWSAPIGRGTRIDHLGIAVESIAAARTCTRRLAYA